MQLKQKLLIISFHNSDCKKLNLTRESNIIVFVWLILLRYSCFLQETGGATNDKLMDPYGEPPPSYKQAKYFPKAVFVTDEFDSSASRPPAQSLMRPNVMGNTAEADSHIYENIEETESVSTKKIRLAAISTGQQRKGKFQSLKKHSLN